MNIAIVDIDNTLWQFCDAFHAELKKLTSAFPPVERWDTWDFFVGYCTEEQFLAAVDAVHRRQDSDEHQPYPEAKGFLRTLREQGYWIVIASHRRKEMQGPTERWLTDDLSSYKVVAEKLQLGHQVCQFHMRRWVGKTLKNLQETLPKPWLWVLEEVGQLLDVLHPEGSQCLYALWKQLPGRSSRRGQARTPLEQLRDLLLRLSEHWHSYCTFQSEPETPWTNNATERAIGRMKMRARTVRGYKSWPGMESGLLIAGSSTA